MSSLYSFFLANSLKHLYEYCFIENMVPMILMEGVTVKIDIFEIRAVENSMMVKRTHLGNRFAFEPTYCHLLSVTGLRNSLTALSLTLSRSYEELIISSSMDC